MKKLLKKSFFLLIGLTSLSSLSAMEKPEATSAPEEQKLFVTNEFSDPVRVAYRLEYKEPLRSLDLIKGETKELPEFKRLKQLSIVPYGKYKEWLSRKTIGIDPFDNYFEVQEKALRYPKEKILELKISSGATSRLGETVKGIVGQFAPYNVEVAPMQPSEKQKIEGVPSDRRLIAALPRLRAAKEAKQPILPRYVLGVGEGASLADIDREYNQLVRKWQPVSEGANKADAEYATDLLRLIKMAHGQLKAEIAAKEQLAIIEMERERHQAEFKKFMEDKMNKFYPLV